MSATTDKIKAMLDGGVLVNDAGAEMFYDPSFPYPFRFRVMDYKNHLCETSHPAKNLSESLLAKFEVKQKQSARTLESRLDALERIVAVLMVEEE